MVTKEGRMGRAYPCKFCNRIFNRRRRFINHGTVHFIERIICVICLKVFQTREFLQTHINRFHPLQYSCKACGKSFICFAKLQDHLRRIPATIPCPMCGLLLHYEKDIARHILIDHDKDFSCYICKEPFTSGDDLKSHLSGHADHAPSVFKKFQCELCGKYLTSHRLKQSHIKRAHIEKGEVACETCGLVLSSLHALKNHAILHRPIKAFKCRFCEKSFHRSTNLQSHERVHTNERPYVCEICGKSFTQLSPKKIHVRLHTGETPYKCNLCDRGFVTKTLLNIHIKRKHAQDNVNFRI